MSWRACAGVLSAPREAGIHGQLAGHDLTGGSASQHPREAGDSQSDLSMLGVGLDRDAADRGREQTIAGRNVLAGSAFALASGASGGGFAGVWGGGTHSGFDGRENARFLDGSATTAML